MNKVLVVVAHADDEVLGCGGAISRHISLGDEVTIIFMTNGVGSRHDNKDEIERRQTAATLALKKLGVTTFHQFDFPDNQMDSIPLLTFVQAIEGVLNSIKPSIIYTHFLHDLNVDHQVTNKAVMTACRPQAQSTVRKVLSFEILSSTEWNSPSVFSFTPQYIVDISKEWSKKLSALKCYNEEMRSFPHSRSYEAVEALAILRGATNGFEKAEAFFVERILVSRDF